MDMQGSGSCLFQGTTQAYSWTHWGKPWYPVEIRKEYFPNTSTECYRYINTKNLKYEDYTSMGVW